jgi:THO complex subunit 2
MERNKSSKKAMIFTNASRRISAETIKESGRRLAKASHSTPTVAFHAILFQLRTYDNMTQSVTDAFKYFSKFGYDVLTCILFETE